MLCVSLDMGPDLKENNQKYFISWFNSREKQ